MNINTYLKDIDKEEKDRLARLSGTTSTYLSQIASGFRKASPKLALAIEKATNKKVTRYEIRPDIYPPD